MFRILTPSLSHSTVGVGLDMTKKKFIYCKGINQTLIQFRVTYQRQAQGYILLLLKDLQQILASFKAWFPYSRKVPAIAFCRLPSSNAASSRRQSQTAADSRRQPQTAAGRVFPFEVIRRRYRENTITKGRKLNMFNFLPAVTVASR